MNSRIGLTLQLLRRHWPAAVAFAAPEISLGGTRMPAVCSSPQGSVGSIQIKREAVTAPKLARNAITANAVKRGTLLRADGSVRLGAWREPSKIVSCAHGIFSVM